MSQPLSRVAVTDFPSLTPNREPEDHMSVHPFQPARHPDVEAPPIYEDDDADDGFDPNVDDLDETLARFGSVGPANRSAHRVINTSVLAALTGYPTYVCEEFHHALFTLLEDVGDFDGLLATPLVCVGRADVFDVAREWLAANPPVDVDAMLAARGDGETDDHLWSRINAAIDAHSLALAAAAGSNPSLTLGSIDAISDVIDDRMIEIALSTMPEQVIALTRVAFELIARLPESVVITGGASRATCLTRDTFDGWQS